MWWWHLYPDVWRNALDDLGFAVRFCISDEYGECLVHQGLWQSLVPLKFLFRKIPYCQQLKRAIKLNYKQGMVVAYSPQNDKYIDFTNKWSFLSALPNPRIPLIMWVFWITGLIFHMSKNTHPTLISVVLQFFPPTHHPSSQVMFGWNLLCMSHFFYGTTW